VVVASSAGALVACVDDDVPPTATADSGLVDHVDDADDVDHEVVPTIDGSRRDAGVTADARSPDAGPPLPHAKLVLVHASPDLPALRICYKLGKAADGSDGVLVPVAALPDQAKPGQPYPGIFPGTGAPFPDLLDLSSYAVTPIFVRAAAIASDVRKDGGLERSCQDILSQDGGLATDDRTEFPTLPVGTFAPSTTLLLAVTGCKANTNVYPFSAQAKCGASYTSSSNNFAIQKYTLDKTPTGAASLGAQFIDLTPAYEGESYVFGGSCGANPSCTANGVFPVIVKGYADGGTSAVVPLTTAPVKFPEQRPTSAVGVSGLDVATDKIAVAGTNTAGDGGMGPLITELSSQAGLPLVQLLTTGSNTPADYFRNGRNYTFLLLGEPSKLAAVQPDGGFNGYGIHYLGFDNDPELPPK
jgi:hypothetical protein